MGTTYDNWGTVQHDQKWKILARQKRFLYWAFYSSLGSIMLGFDFGVAATCTALPAFQQKFGISYPSEDSGYLVPARYQSGWAGASTGGDVVGVLIGSYLVDIVGRKPTLILGCVGTAVGIGMQVAAHEWVLFMMGRLVNAIGFGAVFLVSPVWIGENARPELRGFFLCLVNGSIVLGQLILACAAQGASHITGDWSWKLLVLLQYAFVAPLIFFYPFYPESPYYLLKREKLDEARRSLRKIHGSDDEDLLNAEMNRIAENIRSSQTIQASAVLHGKLLRQCFKKRNIKRTIIALLPPAGQQFIGAGFVIAYSTYFLSLIGIHDYFTVSVVLYVVMLLSNASAFFAIETIGRRMLLVPGIFLLTAILLIMGIMGCIDNNAATWVILVCIFLWAIVYQLTIGAVGFAFSSEIATLPLRGPVQGLIGATQGISGWIVSFVIPYMINPDAGNLGGKVGFVFAGLGVPFCVAFYFLLPETKGMSYEDLDYLFGNNTSCREFPNAIKARQEIAARNLEGEYSTAEVEVNPKD